MNIYFLRKAALAAAWLMLLPGMAFSFSYTLGDTLYTYSSQSQPAKGASFIDSTYNTTITRFTNIAVDNPSIPSNGGVGCGYNTYNPVSNDGTRIMLYGINSVPGIAAYGYQLYDINGVFIADLHAGKNSSPLSWWNSQDPEPRWDRTGNHNTRLYYRKHMQMRYFDVVTKEEGLQHDFYTDFPTMTPATDSNSNGTNMHYILSHEYGGSSTDGRYWAFYIQHSNGSQDVQDYVFVYDMVSNTVVSSKSLGSVAAIKGTMISPSGNYVLINWYALDSSERAASDIYTRNFSTWHRCAQAIPHGNFGWTTQGHEVFTCLDGDNIAYTRCDTGERFDIYDQGSLGWNGNCLFSYTDKHGWQFVSTYAQDNSAWSYNQIWAHELDETNIICGITPPGQAHRRRAA